MRRQLLNTECGVLVVGGVWLSGEASVALAQAAPEKAPEARVDAAALFSKMGCTLCHAPGARYHELLLGASGKSEEELARWIRNPEKFVPGTTMPTYASLIDEPTARVLARWLKDGGAGASAGKK